MLMRGYVKIAGFDDSDAAEFQSSCQDFELFFGWFGIGLIEVMLLALWKKIIWSNWQLKLPVADFQVSRHKTVASALQWSKAKFLMTMQLGSSVVTRVIVIVLLKSNQNHETTTVCKGRALGSIGLRIADSSSPKSAAFSTPLGGSWTSFFTVMKWH